MTFNIIPDYIHRYLKKYSYPNWKLEWNSSSEINCVVVIPAIAEYENIKNLLLSLSENDSRFFRTSLILFVVNNTQNTTKEIKWENKRTIKYLRRILEKKNDDEISTTVINSGLNIGLVDASSEGREMPDKSGGVGMARKIGMDLALSVFNNFNIRNFIVCLDADCTVEQNYLSELSLALLNTNIMAGYVRFAHPFTEDKEKNLAITCYEIFLRYYVLGLKYANSPFAFHTIGSTMFCAPEAYCKVQGMNLKKAAEDFYFMEKLAKSYNISELRTTTVYPSARESWRVPFGTGQRVRRFLAHRINEYLLYSPKSFLVLRAWLECFNSSFIRTEQEYLSEAKNIDTSLYRFLIEQDFEFSWKRILANNKNDEAIRKQKLFWFDGFRTLKLVHYLRDNGYPAEPMFPSVDKMLDLMGYSKPERSDLIPTLKVQLEYLRLMREIS